MRKKNATAGQVTEDNITRSRDLRIHTRTQNIQYLLPSHIKNGQAKLPQCAVPRLCEFYLDICLTTEEKARKKLKTVIHKDKYVHCLSYDFLQTIN
jgi:hypothetical protein